MAFDSTQAITDFDEYQLLDFGETVTYINGTTGSHREIQAVRPSFDRSLMNQPKTMFQPLKENVQILISRGATNGVSNVNEGVDKIKMLVNPNDEHMKTCRITSRREEYGAWRLGLTV